MPVRQPQEVDTAISMWLAVALSDQGQSPQRCSASEEPALSTAVSSAKHISHLQRRLVAIYTRPSAPAIITAESKGLGLKMCFVPEHNSSSEDTH